MRRPIRALAVAAAAASLTGVVVEAADARIVARTARPIVAVAADGADAVVIVRKRISRVAIATGATTNVCRTCGGFNLYAGGGAIATEQGRRQSDDDPFVWEDARLLGSPSGRRLAQLAVMVGGDGESASYGDIVVGAGRIAWRERRYGQCGDECDEPDADGYGWRYPIRLLGAPFALDSPALAIARDGRILLEDGRLLAADGSLLRTLPAGPLARRRGYGRRTGVAFDGGLVVVQTRAGLVAIDAETGVVAPPRRGGGTTGLVDVRDGVALLVRGRDLVALRLADGRRAVLVRVRLGSRLRVGGFADAGAVYAVNRGRTGALGLVPTARIAARLGA